MAKSPLRGDTLYTHAGSNTINYAVAWLAPSRDLAALVTANQGGPEAQQGTDEAAIALMSR